MDKPDYIREFEKDADSGDLWWPDVYQVEDLIAVAAWYRARLDDLLAALEGAEPVAWTLRCPFSNCGHTWWTRHEPGELRLCPECGGSFSFSKPRIVRQEGEDG